MNGVWVRNPQIITDRYVKDGEIVYGEYKSGEEAKEARACVKEHQNNADFELLDREVGKIIWTFANLFPGCLIEVHRRHPAEKEILLGSMKNDHRYWLAANMMRRGFPWLRCLQHQEDHRHGHHRLCQVQAEHRGGKGMGYGNVCRGHGQTEGVKDL